jgi:hypothetical protein
MNTGKCDNWVAVFIQVSSKVQLSDAVWILLSNFQETDTESLQEFFHDIYIPLDCQFLLAHSQDADVIISELYHVTRNLPLTKNYFGIWSQGAGIVVTNISFFERRNDLQGMTMKVATMTVSKVSTTYVDVGEKLHAFLTTGLYGGGWSGWRFSTNLAGTHRWSRGVVGRLTSLKCLLFT